MRSLIAFAAMVGVCTAATGEQIYRCADGYRQTACDGGQPLTLRDSRDATQKLQAEQAQRRDSALADAMERDRKARDATATTARVLARPATDGTTAAESSGMKKPTVFRAVVPARDDAKAQKRRKPTATRKKTRQNPSG